MQTRRQSMAEVVTNTAVGFIGSWVITYLCTTTLEPPATATTAAVIGCTVWSLVRGYYIRRQFAGHESES